MFKAQSDFARDRFAAALKRNQKVWNQLDTRFGLGGVRTRGKEKPVGLAIEASPKAQTEFRVS
jgi:hypothetical protein